MGIPFSFLGLFNDKDEFYDTKIGNNVQAARHALGIDEIRQDFEPTIWQPKQGLDLKQVWFAGAHADIGGSYKPDKSGLMLSDIALEWMIAESRALGLTVEAHLAASLNPDPTAKVHQSRRKFYRVRGAHYRPVDHGCGPVLIHQSVKKRWDRDKSYRPKKLAAFVQKNGWDPAALVP